MAKAIWNGAVIAESDETLLVEGNHYFPVDSVDPAYLRANEHHSTCPWKGVASYYDVEVDGKVNANAAWHYPHPTVAARRIQNYVAFWKGVQVTD